MPISPYGAAKVAAELYCQAFAALGQIETVAFRYFNVFGPRQDPNSEYSAVIPRFITADARRQAADGVLRRRYQSRDFTFVGDVVAGNLLAADATGRLGPDVQRGQREVNDLLNCSPTLNRLLRTNVEPIFAPPRAGDVRESLADITLARQHLELRAASRFRGRPPPLDRLLLRPGRETRLAFVAAASSRRSLVLRYRQSGVRRRFVWNSHQIRATP